MLIQGMVLGLSAALSPGAFQAFLLARSLSGGWRRTWMAAFAPLLSDGPVVALVLLVLWVVPDWLVRGLRLAGGLFLLYLAWGVLRGLRSRQKAGAAPPTGSVSRLTAQAMLTNLLSPGPWLFWSTVAGPVFLQSWRRAALEGLGFLAGFYAAMVISLLVLIAVFSLLGKAQPRLVWWIHLLSGLLLAGFGLYQFVGGLIGG